MVRYERSEINEWTKVEGPFYYPSVVHHNFYATELDWGFLFWGNWTGFTFHCQTEAEWEVALFTVARFDLEEILEALK